MRLRCSILAGLALLVAVTVASPAVGAAPARGKASPRLHAFGSCGTLLGYARRNGVRVIDESTPVMDGRGGGGVVGEPGGGSGGGRTEPVSANPAPATGEGDSSGSPTNVQEAGVDEPDIVKTSGSVLYTVGDGGLRAIDAGASLPRLLGSLALEGYDHQLLVRGTRGLVISTRGFGDSGPRPVPEGVAVPAIAPPKQWLSGTRLTEVDLTDPAAPRVLRTLDVEGDYVNARLTGATARVVVSSSPRGLETPQVAPSAQWKKVRRSWRRSVRRARAATWLPAMVLRDKRTGRKTRRALVRCRQVRRPRVFSGLNTISVLTIDMDKGLPAVDVDSLMTGGETVYASPDRLYVASERWLGEDPTRKEVASLSTTGLHAFDTTRPGETGYVGSGEISGYLLNQWSLSEQDRVLRVASTDQPPWDEDGGRSTESAVRTLEERDGRLVQIGAVGGLGKGERIFAVRFMGTTGFVVTFRQTDPLYTLDLTDPRAPRLVGELKVPGYSAYLHPLGDGLLLGVGQDATEEGRTRGVQVSLFDVSDLRNPVRLSQQTLAGNSWSEVEEDHHAFLWWAPERLAVIPAVVFDEEGARQEFGGAAAFRVDRAGGVQPVARVGHPFRDGYAPPFRRSLVIGDRLVLVSDEGVASTPVAEQGPAVFMRYPG